MLLPTSNHRLSSNEALTNPYTTTRNLPWAAFSPASSCPESSSQIIPGWLDFLQQLDGGLGPYTTARRKKRSGRTTEEKSRTEKRQMYSEVESEEGTGDVENGNIGHPCEVGSYLSP